IYQKSPSETGVQSQCAPTPTNVDLVAPTIRKSVVREERIPIRQRHAEQPISREVLPGHSLWQQATAAANVEDWQKALILLATMEAEDKFQPQVFYLRALIQLH